MDPNILREMEIQRELQKQAPQEQAPAQESFISPQEREWANMMINAINQMGAMNTDPGFHTSLANSYLGLLGQLQPYYDSPIQGIEAYQLGQMFGDQDMMSHGQNTLREDMGLGPTPSYQDQVMNQSLGNYFQREFPVMGDETGGLSADEIRNLQVQLEGQENPNLIRQYMDTDLGFFEKLFKGKDKEKELKLKKAGFNI